MKSTIERPTSSAGENLAAALNEGVESAVAVLPPSLFAVPSYPVQVTFERSRRANRFFAFPALGFAVKSIILVPHLLALAMLVTAASVLQLGVWLPVMLTGAYPAWAYNLVGGTLRYWMRVEAYFFGLTDRYPPFALGEEPGYPVHVTFQPQASYNMAWATPILGLLVWLVLALPHLIILWAFRLVAEVMVIVLWIPVLFTGMYPEWGYQIMGGFLTWNTRVASYLLGLTDRYPPFQMG